MDPVRGEVIAFVSTDPTEVALDFALSVGALEAVTKELGVGFRTVEIDDGAPAAVKITPLLVYQNCWGRSIFQGRYTQVDRFRTFLRTARLIPQGVEATRSADRFIASRRDGRTTTAIVVKVTPLTGSIPDSHDESLFQKNARRIVLDHLADFQRSEGAVELGRSDRVFYCDFHPYLSADGHLFVTASVFSQFNCHVPVWVHDRAIGFDWAESRFLAFADSAELAATMVDEAIVTAGSGDGFDPIPRAVATVSWEDLGLALPEPPERASATDVAQDLPTRWRMERELTGADAVLPRLQFRFPAPLDNYGGEVERLSGDLEFGDGTKLTSVRGTVTAEATSVTMGEVDLDASILGKGTLDTARFPTATFTIESVDSADDIAFGELSAAVMTGAFQMKDVSIPLTVPANFEAGLGEDGEPQLVATGSFEIPLKSAFGIDGPDGPSPQRDHLQFFFRLVYQGVE